MQDLYVAEDDFWKIINYATQLIKERSYTKAGIKICIDHVKEAALLYKTPFQTMQMKPPEFEKDELCVYLHLVTLKSWPSNIFRTGCWYI